MRRLSTLSPKTTSTSGDDVNVNVNAQYNVNHLTVTPQLHLHLHLGIQFYLTAPQLPSSPYMSPTHGPDARDERSRRRPEAAEGAVVTYRVDTNGFRACRFGLQPLSVSRQVFYIFISIFAGSCSRLVALSRLFGPARRVAPVPHGRCGRCIPIWIRVAGESHCLRRPMPPHSCAARARCRAGRALLKRLRQARAQTVSRALLATGT